MVIHIETLESETVMTHLEASDSQDNAWAPFDNSLDYLLSANAYFLFFRVPASDKTLKTHNQIFHHLKSVGYLSKLDNAEIHRIAYELNSHSKVFEKFRKFSPHNQDKITFKIRTKRGFRALQLYWFIQALELAGNPDISFLDFGLYNFESFIAPFEGKVNEDNIYLPSKKFHIICKKNIEVVVSGHLTFNTLHVLRVIYGEERILEFFEHFDLSGVDWSRLNFVEIIERWEIMKEYPPEWIAKLVEESG